VLSSVGLRQKGRPRRDIFMPSTPRDDSLAARARRIEAKFVDVPIGATEVLPAIAGGSLVNLADEFDAGRSELCACGDDIVDKKPDHDVVRTELLRWLRASSSEDLNRIAIARDKFGESRFFDDERESEYIAEERYDCFDTLDGDTRPGDTKHVHSRTIASTRESDRPFSFDAFDQLPESLGGAEGTGGVTVARGIVSGGPPAPSRTR